MPVIYNVTIKPTEDGNRLHITWHNPATNTVDSFEHSIEITPDEIHLLCHQQRYQLTIGNKLFRFLDSDAGYFKQALDKANRKGETLQLNLCACKQTADWPFELLAKDNIFLLPQQLHLVRCVSHQGKEEDIPPVDRPLKLLFMACSAVDVKPELDFEGEEEAIFKITEKLPVHIEVEDSGSLEGLHNQLAQLEEEHYDVVHLSGHADIDKNGHPYFVMEDETGYHCNVFPEELWNQALVKNSPRLLFLSGCRTGQVPDSSVITGTPENIAEGSFARLLVEKGKVPAVLGWGRPVNDKEASRAGRMLYRELSRGRSILEAVQRTRFELKKEFPHSDKPAWPLLRLYNSGIMALNALVEKHQHCLPVERPMRYVYLENSRVRVLAEGFVGRRRQLQTGLRALKQDTDKIGLLLLGTGGLGKSCLAGKFCERFTDHTLIIVHGEFNAISLEDALKDAFIKAQDEAGQQLLSQNMTMTDKLLKLRHNNFKEKNYLLLLDGFEQNIEGADKGQPGPLQPEAAVFLSLLLRHLPVSGKKTQLIITCRYEFSLSQQDRDLVDEHLCKIWPTGFRESEQLKKVQGLQNILNYPDQTLAPRLLAEGYGNPRLMEWLNLLVGQMKAADVNRLLEAIKDKQEDFINAHVLRELIRRGDDELDLFLRWFSIYRGPVLEAGVELVAEKSGLSGWRKLLQLGKGLSLVEHDQVRDSYQVVPLLREELLNGLEDHNACHEAAYAYYKRVCDDKDWINPVLTREWIFHALGCGEEEVASRQAGNLVNFLRDRLALLESRQIGEWVLEEKKQQISTGNDGILLSSLACTMIALDDSRKAVDYLGKALLITRRAYGEEHPGVANILINLGAAWKNLGNPKKAIEFYQQAYSIEQSVYGEGYPDSALTLNNLGLAWDELGEHHKAIDYYMKALAIFKKVDGSTHPKMSDTLNNIGMAWYSLGEHHKALDYYQQAILIDRSLYGEEHPNIATTLSSIGIVWLSLGEYTKAIDYHHQALVILKKVYGEIHTTVAKTLNNLAASLEAMGDFRKAIEYFEQVLKIEGAVYGEEHPDYAVSLINLGSAWHSFGKYKKAIGYFQQALAIFKKVYGEKHPNVATALNNLGGSWGAIENFRQAVKCFQQALSIRENIYGKKHPSVANTMNNLGGTWEALGENKKAIQYYRQALTIFKNVYGDRHPKVATVLSSIGAVSQSSSEYKKAMDYHQQALTIERAVHGETHPDVAITLSKLGSTSSALGDYRQAIAYYEQALSLDRAVYGETHPKVIKRLNLLGLTWKHLGEYDKAVDYYQQTLSIYEREYGEEPSNVAGTLSELGSIWADLGKPDKSIKYYQKALSIYKGEYGVEHPGVAGTLNKLGSVWKDLGDLNKAIDCHQEALSIERAAHGENHPEVANTLNDLGNTWREFGQPGRAIEYYQKALSIYKKEYGENHPDVANTLNFLGLAWKYLGEYKKVIDYYRQALEILQGEYGELHPSVVRQLNNLGELWRVLGKPGKAIDYFNQVLAIRKKNHTDKQPEVAATLSNLGSAWVDSGEFEKAIEYYSQALSIAKAEYGEEHPHVATTLNNLGTAYSDWGKKEQAKDYLEKAYIIYNKFFGPQHPFTKNTGEWLKACR
jgi:tetratricopeptide (TPR) repeat protein